MRLAHLFLVCFLAINLLQMPLLPKLLRAEVGEHDRAEGADLLTLGVGFTKMMQSSFNESQFQAIKAAAATRRGFTLVKGPPGTGKTTTLKGLLNSLHLREYARFYKAILKVSIFTSVEMAMRMKMRYL